MSDTFNKSLLVLGVTGLVGYLTYSMASKNTENYIPFAQLNQYAPVQGTSAGGVTVYYPNCEGNVNSKFFLNNSFTSGAPFLASPLARFPISDSVSADTSAGNVFTVAPGERRAMLNPNPGAPRGTEFFQQPKTGSFYSTTAKASTDIPAHSGLQSQVAMGKRMLTGVEKFIANTGNPTLDYGCGRTQSVNDQMKQRLERFSNNVTENFEQPEGMVNPDLDKIIQAQAQSEMDAGFGPYVAESISYTAALEKDKYSRFTDMIRGDIPIVTTNVPWEFQRSIPDVDPTISNPGYINSTTGHGCPSEQLSPEALVAETNALLNPRPSIAQQYGSQLSGVRNGRVFDTVVNTMPNRM